jgi:hypothetical protein
MKIWIALCMAWSFALPCHAQQSPPDGVLRVCQDPNNLPFSNLKGEGYENKIAELLAQKPLWRASGSIEVLDRQGLEQQVCGC